jgi:hypothetical protein
MKDGVGPSLADEASKGLRRVVKVGKRLLLASAQASGDHGAQLVFSVYDPSSSQVRVRRAALPSRDPPTVATRGVHHCLSLQASDVIISTPAIESILLRELGDGKAVEKGLEDLVLASPEFLHGAKAAMARGEGPVLRSVENEEVGEDPWNPGPSLAA